MCVRDERNPKGRVEDADDNVVVEDVVDDDVVVVGGDNEDESFLADEGSFEFDVALSGDDKEFGEELL